MWNSIPLKRRFELLTGLIAITVIVSSVILLTINSKIVYLAEKIGNTDIPMMNEVYSLSSAVVHTQQWLTDISATRGLDGLNDGFNEAEKSAEDFRDSLKKLTQLAPERNSQIQALATPFEQFYSKGKEMAQAYVDQGPSAGNAMMSDFDERAESLYEKLNTLESQIKNQVIEETKEETLATQVARNTVFINIIAIMGVLAISYFTFIRIFNQLPVLNEELHRIADGNLAKEINVEKYQAISELMEPLEETRKSLANIVKQIVEYTTELTQSASSLLRTSEQAKADLDAQQVETNQAATAVNEMTVTSHEVSQNVSEAANAATDANNETTEGKRIVNDATHEIEGLSSQISSTAATIQQLGEDSEAINTVIDVIRSIAEQTNLLALNAAIEAARAGEQGRGFAVVADEVRTLASRTQQSTEEINQMIQKLQEGAKQAVESMNVSCDQVSAAVEKTSEAENSLTRITDAVSRINQMSLQIATAAEEQSQVAEEINRNITSINEKADHAVETAIHTQNTSAHQANIANELKRLVDRFHV